MVLSRCEWLNESCGSKKIFEVQVLLYIMRILELKGGDSFFVGVCGDGEWEGG